MVYKGGPSHSVFMESSMKVFHRSRVGWYVLVVTLTTLAFAVDVSAKEPSVTSNAKTPLSYSRPWLMVGLSPDGCSRGCRHVFSVVKELSGNHNGLIVHFSKVTPEWLAEIQPAFIILSPQGTPWCRYTGEMGVSLQNFLWTLPMAAEEMNIPILGICGGHQALALAFGGKVGPIRAGEDDCMPYSRERQGGVVPLTLTTSDPIFRGIDGKLRVVESHFDEVKVLPPGFVLLASDKISPNQIMRHPTKPVYGIQGHPECSYGSRAEGRIFIRNFLEIAAAHNQIMRSAHRLLIPKFLSQLTRDLGFPEN
jgi:GMP synthase (glutamine-hydrolysing)